MEDNGWEAEVVLLGISMSVLPVGKSSKLCDQPSFVLSTLQMTNYIEVQYMFTHTRPNMHAASVCFRNPPNHHTDYRIFYVLT